MRVLGLLAVGFAVGRATAPTPPAVVAEPLNAGAIEKSRPVDVEIAGDEIADEPSDALLTEDEKDRRTLVGVWTTKSHGTQVCTLNNDGTGDVKAQLDWMAALLYGNKLDMNIEWRVEDGHLVQTLLDGKPADMVEKLKADYGAVKRYRIESLDEETGVLIDTGDGERTVWKSLE